MNDMQKRVLLFHQKFGFTVRTTPTIIPQKLSMKRQKYLIDECEELREAILEDDIEGIADGLADVLYFTIGTALAFGIDMTPIFDEVHRSNMTKTVAGVSEMDAKALKGEDYEPPVLMPILLRQKELGR